MDYAIGEFIYMLPSDMNLRTGNVRNYNNKILISSPSFKIGTYLKVNLDVKPKEVEMVKTEPDVKPKDEGIVKTKPDVKQKKEPDIKSNKEHKQDVKPNIKLKHDVKMIRTQALHGLAPKCELINMHELMNKSTNNYVTQLPLKNGTNWNTKR